KTIDSNHKIGKRKKIGTQKNLYRLQIGSIEMCNDLRSLGLFENKTKNMVVPNIPKKYFNSFTRGYFDGDGNVWSGYIHKERKLKTRVIFVAFTSCSSMFLNELKNKLKIVGLKGGSIYKPKNKNFSRLQFS